MEGIAIGFSLTGTMNSPRSANLAMLYSSEGVNGQQQRLPDGLQTPLLTTSSPGEAGQTLLQPPVFRLPSIQTPPNVPTNIDATRISEADLLLNLHSPYPAPIPRMPGRLTASHTAPSIDFIHNSSLN